jgi:hypothetical protein
MHRRKINPTGYFAQNLRVPTVRLDATSSDAEATDQRRRYDADLMCVTESEIRNVKSFRAGLEDYSTVRLTLEKDPQMSRKNLLLTQNFAVASSNAKLRFLSAEIDRNMLHGRLSFAAP